LVGSFLPDQSAETNKKTDLNAHEKQKKANKEDGKLISLIQKKMKAIKKIFYSLMAVVLVAVATYNVKVALNASKVQMASVSLITLEALAFELNAVEKKCMDEGGIYDEVSRFQQYSDHTLTCEIGGEISAFGLKWLSSTFKVGKTYKVTLAEYKCESKPPYCCKQQGGVSM
jgi:hypothetical protein